MSDPLFLQTTPEMFSLAASVELRLLEVIIARIKQSARLSIFNNSSDNSSNVVG
jgi:hypothetical protein